MKNALSVTHLCSTKNERAKILKNPTGKYNHKELTKPFYDKVKDKDDVTKIAVYRY